MVFFTTNPSFLPNESSSAFTDLIFQCFCQNRSKRTFIIVFLQYQKIPSAITESHLIVCDFSSSSQQRSNANSNLGFLSFFDFFTERISRHWGRVFTSLKGGCRSQPLLVCSDVCTTQKRNCVSTYFVHFVKLVRSVCRWIPVIPVFLHF